MKILTMSIISIIALFLIGFWCCVRIANDSVNIISDEEDECDMEVIE